jgi:truncated hemoglobin YjbI
MATADRIEVFHASLDRIGTDPAFLDRFYDAFIDANPDVRPFFEGVDMRRLKRKLKSSLHLVTLAVDEAPGASDYLLFLGRMHARFRLEPEHFQFWIDALVQAVSESDTEFDRQVEAAWRQVLGEAMVLMNEGLVGHATN